MGSITGRVAFSGKFFAARDPGQTIKDNIRAYLDDVAREVESEVRTGFRSGEAGRRPVTLIGGRVSERIRGRVESLTGKPWQYHVVVSPANTGLGRDETVALYAAASKVEGRDHVFRNATRIQRRAVRDLTAGLE